VRPEPSDEAALRPIAELGGAHGSAPKTSRPPVEVARLAVNTATALGVLHRFHEMIFVLTKGDAVLSQDDARVNHLLGVLIPRPEFDFSA
jgi:hypothetical protein